MSLNRPVAGGSPDSRLFVGNARRIPDGIRPASSVKGREPTDFRFDRSYLRSLFEKRPSLSFLHVISTLHNRMQIVMQCDSIPCVDQSDRMTTRQPLEPFLNFTMPCLLHVIRSNEILLLRWNERREENLIRCDDRKESGCKRLHKPGSLLVLSDVDLM